MDPTDGDGGAMSTNCPLHGSIPIDHVCGDTPVDHSCAEHLHPDYDPVDGDQGCSFREALRIESEKLHLIHSLHTKTEGAGGTTDGICAECGTLWPCRTVHLANGWGLGDECYEAGWCEHARRPVA